MATRDVLAAYEAMSEDEQAELLEILQERERLRKRAETPKQAQIEETG